MKKIGEKWVNKVLGGTTALRLISKTKRTSLPGFGGVSLYNVTTFIYGEARKDDLLTRSNSMAFSFFISLFPFLIVLLSIMSFLPTDDFISVLEESMGKVMPLEAERYIIGIIQDLFGNILSKPMGGTLSIGFVLAFYFASNGILAMMRGFDKTYEITFKSRNIIQKRIAAIRLTILVGILLSSSLVLIILGNLIFSWFQNRFELGGYTFITLQFVKWVGLIVLFYGVISMLYRYGPAMKKKTPLISPGATLATVLSILSSIAFSYFVNNFGNYNRLYGSLAALIMVMLWIQINCFILLIGFELNASIAVNKDRQKQEGLLE